MNPPLSRTPWKNGRVPEKSDVCEGRVSGVWAMPFLNLMPRAANPSMVGVWTWGNP